jgi:hypothetical protein
MKDKKDLNSTKMDQRGKNPGQTTKKSRWRRIFFFSPKRPDRLWCLPSLLLIRCRGSFAGSKTAGKVSKSPPFRADVSNERSCKPSWHGQGKF